MSEQPTKFVKIISEVLVTITRTNERRILNSSQMARADDQDEIGRSIVENERRIIDLMRREQILFGSFVGPFKTEVVPYEFGYDDANKPNSGR